MCPVGGSDASQPQRSDVSRFSGAMPCMVAAAPRGTSPSPPPRHPPSLPLAATSTALPALPPPRTCIRLLSTGHVPFPASTGGSGYAAAPPFTTSAPFTTSTTPPALPPPLTCIRLLSTGHVPFPASTGGSGYAAPAAPPWTPATPWTTSLPFPPPAYIRRRLENPKLVRRLCPCTPSNPVPYVSKSTIPSWRTRETACAEERCRRVVVRPKRVTPGDLAG